MSWISQGSNHARKNMQPSRRKPAVVTAHFDLFQNAIDENFFISLNFGVLCVRSLARISKVFPRSAGERRLLLETFVPVEQRYVELEPLPRKALSGVAEEL